MKVEFEIDDVGRDPIHDLFFRRDELFGKLYENKLLKADRDDLVEAMDIIVMLYAETKV